jgi:hypothetical protein
VVDEVGDATREEPQEANADGDGEREGVGRFLYRLALAGVGSVVLAQEELSGLFKRAESDEEDEESAEGKSVNDAGSNSVNATIDRVLHTFNLASRNDVDELTQKIDELTAKIAALRA